MGLFLVFAGPYDERTTPWSGGWEAYQGECATEEEAVAFLTRLVAQATLPLWGQVVDFDTREVIQVSVA